MKYFFLLDPGPKIVGLGFLGLSLGFEKLIQYFDDFIKKLK